jgi:hypothetical protein
MKKGKMKCLANTTYKRRKNSVMQKKNVHRKIRAGDRQDFGYEKKVVENANLSTPYIIKEIFLARVENSIIQKKSFF